MYTLVHASLVCLYLALQISFNCGFIYEYFLLKIKIGLTSLTFKKSKFVKRETLAICKMNTSNYISNTQLCSNVGDYWAIAVRLSSSPKSNCTRFISVSSSLLPQWGWGTTQLRLQCTQPSHWYVMLFLFLRMSMVTIEDLLCLKHCSDRFDKWISLSQTDCTIMSTYKRNKKLLNTVLANTTNSFI